MKESIRDFLLPVHSPACELPAKKMNVFLIWIIFLYRERINKTNEEIVQNNLEINENFKSQFIETNNNDGNSLVQLSLETAAGKYHTEAVAYINYIIIQTKKLFKFKFQL